MPVFEVVVKPVEEHGGHIRASADFLGPGAPHTAWYELDPEHRPILTDRADPFLLAALLSAMHLGLDLHVRGAPVSPSLLRNLAEFQQIWHTWWGPAVVDVVAETEAERDGPRPAETVVSCSGGVDSMFTAHRYTVDPPRYHRPVGAALMLHGMDVPIDDTDGFTGAHARTKTMLASIGLDLIPMRTNTWAILPGDTVRFAAPGVAAAMHLLSGRFGAGLFSSTAHYGALVHPLNSTPTSDPLLGGDSFAVVHDGAAFTRVDKIRHLAQWDEAVDNLRVCIEDVRHDRNCGRCRKCLLTYITFLAVGVQPRCFSPAPTPEAVLAFARRFSSHPVYVDEMRAVIAEAEARGLTDPWVKAARRRHRVVTARNAAASFAPGATARATRLYRKVIR